MKNICCVAWQADDADFAFQMQRSRLDQAAAKQLASLGIAGIERRGYLGFIEESDISRHQA
jgi:hypothetical protein